MRDQRMTRNAKVVRELSYFCVVVFLCASHAPFGVLFFSLCAHLRLFVHMAHLFSMSSYSCLTCFAAFCFCATCTTGAQHRTLEERPILSGYRWQF